MEVLTIHALLFHWYDGRVNVCEGLRVFSTEVLFWKDEDGTLSELKEIKPKSYLSEQAEELSSDIFMAGKTYRVFKAVIFYSSHSSGFHKFPLFKERVRISDVLAAFQADAAEVEVMNDKFEEVQNLTLEPPVHDDTILLMEEHGLGVHMVWPEDHPSYFVHASPGTCAIVVLVLGKKKVFIANAGDCCCSLFRNGELTHLTTDHCPGLPKERERILKAGGCVSGYSRGRVSIKGREREIGELNISRGIGDLHFKMNDKIPQEQQITTAVPDIVEVDISKDCEYLVIYSDGVRREELSSKCKEMSKALKERDEGALEKIFFSKWFLYERMEGENLRDTSL